MLRPILPAPTTIILSCHHCYSNSCIAILPLKCHLLMLASYSSPCLSHQGHISMQGQSRDAPTVDNSSCRLPRMGWMRYVGESMMTEERLAFGMQRCSRRLLCSQCRSPSTRAGHTCCRRTHAPPAAAMQSVLPAWPTFSAMRPCACYISQLWTLLHAY